MSDKVAEEAPSTKPRIEKLALNAKLTGSMEQIREKIKAIPFYATDLAGNVLTIARVESRNIRKMPYLFYIIELSDREVSVSYSIPADVGENMRRAMVLKDLASLLSLISEYYSVDEPTLLQYVNSTLENILSGLSQPYNTLFNQYTSISTEYRSLKKLNMELAASNRNLTVQAGQLTEENKKLNDELKKLQKYSDESLMVMVQDWIEVHNDAIDLEEFSKTYGIATPRVEEILDKMVSLGYLELRS